MKPRFNTVSLLMAVMHQVAFAASGGPLFNVNASGFELSITTTVPKHTYPAAGIRINTPGVTFASNSPGCTMSATSAYCLFRVSDNTAANIVTSSDSYGPVSFTLCLNGTAGISCQNYTRSLIPTSTTPQVTVGYYISSTNVLVPTAYTSQTGGYRWSLTNSGGLPLLPPPTDAAINARSDLNYTRCDSSRQSCFALGYYRRGAPPTYATSIGEVPLGYYSSNGGQSWFSSSIPLPINIRQTNVLNAVLLSTTCSDSGLNCTEVGNYVKATPNIAIPLAYASSNGGQSWVLSNSGADLPLPSDARQGAGTSALLGSAAGSSGQQVVAVGFYAISTPPLYTSAAGEAPLSYTSNDSGNTWSLSSPTPPLPSNAARNLIRLRTTACNASGQNCTALGFYNQTNNQGIVPLSYFSSNGGQTWALSNSGTPPLMPLPSNAVQGANLTAGDPISAFCDSTGSVCIAVSIYTRNDSTTLTQSIGRVPMGYTSTNNGRTWTLREFPLPSDIQRSTTSNVNLARTFFCNSTGQQCNVVGNYPRGTASSSYTEFNGVAPLSYVSTDFGQTWQLSNQGKALPLPADAAQGTASTVTRLYQVTCDGSDLACVAVGEYSYVGSINFASLPLAYTSPNGGNTWYLSPRLPLPSDSRPIPNTGLRSVS